MEGYEEQCKYLGMIAESARRNMEDNGDLDPILETYVDELRNNPTIINELKGIKQIEDVTVKGEKLMGIFNTIFVDEDSVSINFDQMVQYINAFSFDNLAEWQSGLAQTGRIGRLTGKLSDSLVEANLPVEADIRDDLLLGSIDLHLSGEEDQSALVYEKGIITGIIDRYGGIIEELETKLSGAPEEERSSLLVEKTEYIKQKEKLDAYLRQLDLVSIQDKKSNKYLGSMVLKTLISIMSEEVKSLSLILHGDLNELSGGSFLKGGGEEATKLLAEIEEFIGQAKSQNQTLDSQDLVELVEIKEGLNTMEDDDDEQIDEFRDSFESIKDAAEIDDQDESTGTSIVDVSERSEPTPTGTSIVDVSRLSERSEPTMGSQVTVTKGIKELKIIHENLISMSRKNKQSGVSYPGKSNCLLKLLQYGSVVALFASLCDLFKIDDLSSEDPIYDREIESYLINGIDMGNLSNITGLKDFVSGNTNDIGIHFLLMKDPTYNNLYNFMKGIVKSDSIGSIFNTFINVNYAMFGESIGSSSRSGTPQGPTQDTYLLDEPVNIEITQPPTTADVAAAAVGPLSEFDVSGLKYGPPGEGGGKRSKRLKRNIRTNKKKSNNKKRRTNNKRSKRNNKLTNHKRSKR
jgi:hypothetical protein